MLAVPAHKYVYYNIFILPSLSSWRVLSTIPCTCVCVCVGTCAHAKRRNALVVYVYIYGYVYSRFITLFVPDLRPRITAVSRRQYYYRRGVKLIGESYPPTPCTQYNAYIYIYPRPYLYYIRT